jgi:hypothetical protein
VVPHSVCRVSDVLWQRKVHSSWWLCGCFASLCAAALYSHCLMVEEAVAVVQQRWYLPRACLGLCVWVALQQDHA